MTQPGRPADRWISRRTRRLLVFLHVAVSVGWMGAGAANVVLAMTAAGTSDVAVRRVCYLMIHRLDVVLVIPLAFAALATGLALSLLTTWGLVRYWWVLAKLVLTVGVIVFSTFGVGVWVERSIADTAAGSASSGVAAHLVHGAAANIVAFVFMTWASVIKPWGRTPWARPAVPRGPRPAGDVSPHPMR